MNCCRSDCGACARQVMKALNSSKKVVMIFIPVPPTDLRYGPLCKLCDALCLCCEYPPESIYHRGTEVTQRTTETRVPRMLKLLRKSCRQPCLHLRPFVIEDTEDNRIANAAAGQDQVFAQDAFLLRAQAKNGRARLFVENIGDQFDSITPPILERVRQHQQLTFRVYCRALRALG